MLDYITYAYILFAKLYERNIDYFIRRYYMAGKYYIKGKDITTLCEPRVTAWGDSYKTAFTSYFAGDNTAIDGLHKGSDDLEDRVNTNYSNDPGFYVYPGHASFAARGYLPTYIGSDGSTSYVGSITRAGLWSVERTDAGIYFYGLNDDPDYSFPASKFRNGIVPHELLVIFVAGGGGGGGTGHYDSNGSSKGGDVVPIVGGAGGGGGVYAARVVVNDFKNALWQIGNGGAAGSNGSTSVNSTGGGGGRGGNTGILINGGELIGCLAKGGSGGRGGVGNSDGTGTPGSGGSGGTGEGGYCTRVATMAGGTGNSYKLTNVSGTNGMEGVYVTKDTGQPMVTLRGPKRNNNSHENTHDKANQGAYFSGGCSWDWGAYRDSGGNFAAAGYGGGGGSGDIKSTGGCGAIYLYY